MAKVRIKHVSWRDGRPRFSPGPELRMEGWRSKDLQHNDGTWFTLGEALDWSLKFQRLYRAKKLPRGRRRSAVRAEIEDRPQSPNLETCGSIYFLWQGDAIKIGFSRKPASRLRALGTAMSAPPRIFVALPGTLRDEREWHSRLATHRLDGEWFRASLTVVRAIQRFLLAALDPRFDPDRARTISHVPVFPRTVSRNVPHESE